MSLRTSLSKLDDETKKKIQEELYFSSKETTYNKGNVKTIQPFELVGDDLLLPFRYGKDLGLDIPKREDFPTTDVKFTLPLRDIQKEAKSATIKSFNEHGSYVISLYPGCGKTALAIYIAAKIALKTLVITHRIVLIDQWKYAISKFAPDARTQVLKPGKPVEDADFYILNPVNAPKFAREDLQHIGMVVVDELHLIMTESMSKSLLHLHPRYLLGLSATPYRSDGMDALMEAYFGKEKFFRPLKHPHTVFRVPTGFKPVVKTSRIGKVDWNAVLESQCGDPDRNDLIMRIAAHFKERNFLILCKRVEQTKFLTEELCRRGEDATSLFGVKNKFDYDSRILVATCSKAGVGFDHPKLDALIIASDIVEYFIQYLGRVFREKDNNPLVFDLVDDYGVLQTHWRTRRKVYLEADGAVREFKISFPEFKV